MNIINCSRIVNHRITELVKLIELVKVFRKKQLNKDLVLNKLLKYQ